MEVPGHVLRSHRMTAVEKRPLTIAQNRDLGATLRAPIANHPEDRPVRAGVGNLRQIPPRQRNAVAAIDRSQKPWRISIKEMPVRVRRNLRHPPHDNRRSELQPLTGFDSVLLTRQESTKRHLRTQQRPSKEAAFKVTPGVKHILRIHAAIADTTFGAAPHLTTSRVFRFQTITTMKHAVRKMRRQVKLQTCRVRLQRPIEIAQYAATQRTTATRYELPDRYREQATACDQTTATPTHAACKASTCHPHQAETAAHQCFQQPARDQESHSATSPDASESVDARTAAQLSPSAQGARESPLATHPSQTKTKVLMAHAPRHLVAPAPCPSQRQRSHRETNSPRAETQTRVTASSGEGVRLLLSIMLR